MGRNKRGFSLIELIIVVAIILVIMAIGTPYFLRSTQRAYEVSALLYLRHIHSAQETYRLTNGEYADRFTELTPFITGELQSAALWNTPTSYGLVTLAVAAPMYPAAPSQEQEDGEEESEEESTPPRRGWHSPRRGWHSPRRGWATFIQSRCLLHVYVSVGAHPAGPLEMHWGTGSRPDR